jgi:hypothetical protein
MATDSFQESIGLGFCQISIRDFLPNPDPTQTKLIFLFKISKSLLKY